jgi:hypothetical protein
VAFVLSLVFAKAAAHLFGRMLSRVANDHADHARYAATVTVANMRVDSGVHGVLGGVCLVGLSRTLGTIDWGAEVSLSSRCSGSFGCSSPTGLAAEIQTAIVDGRVPTTMPMIAASTAPCHKRLGVCPFLVAARCLLKEAPRGESSDRYSGFCFQKVLILTTLS